MISMFTDLGVGVLFWAGGRHEVVLLFSFLLKVDTIPPFRNATSGMASNGLIFF